MKCKVCNRPLKSLASIQMGMGPVCAAKNAVKRESKQENEYMDIVPISPGEQFLWARRLEPRPGRIQTNIPWITRDKSPSGYEWGYAGSGPAELARNVLIHCVGRSLADKWFQTFKFGHLGVQGDEIRFEIAEVRRIVDGYEAAQKQIAFPEFG